jgi:uncharacterized membrane protein YvlD (DUF360 family)
MQALIFRILLSALAFMYILPLIAGIEFHGGFLTAIGMAILFGVMFWLIDALAVAISAVLAITSLGTALLWLIPFWILFFWLIPAAALMAVSSIAPSAIFIANTTAAALGGLVLLAISLVTSDMVWHRTA